MKLASIFTNHMVLQANKPIEIFGEGMGSISIEFLGESFSFVSENDNWCVSLKAYPYGGPYEMKIILNNEKIVLNDIYVGEVWLFSGQSNMEMPLFGTAYGIEEAEQSKNDKIRFFTVPHRVEKEKQLYGWYFQKSDGKDRPWQLCC